MPKWLREGTANPSSAGSNPAVASKSFVLRSGFVLPEVASEGGSFTWFASRFNLSVVSLDNPMSEREPDTRSGNILGAFEASERLKGPERVCPEANSVVLHDQPRLILLDLHPN